VIAALVIAQAVGAGAGIPTVTSFEKASDAIAFFGKAVPTPDPNGGKFAICYESMPGQPMLTVFLEYRGTGPADGRLIDSRVEKLRAMVHDHTFKDYKLRCVPSPKVAQVSRP
jgi:hypothetical protein